MRGGSAIRVSVFVPQQTERMGPVVCCEARCCAPSAFICFRQLAAIYGDQHRLVRCWAIEGSAEDLLGVTDERCCQIARSATSAMRGELQQRGRPVPAEPGRIDEVIDLDRKSTRLNSSHGYISYAVFCLKKKKKDVQHSDRRSQRSATRTALEI